MTYTKNSCFLLLTVLFYYSASVPAAQQLSYTQWKAQKQRTWKKHGIRERCNISRSLVHTLKPWFNSLSVQPKLPMVYAYNFLRELWGATSIKDAAHMSRQWLQQIEGRRIQEYYGHSAPSVDQQRWLDEAKKGLHLTSTPIILGSTNRPFEAFTCSTALDLQYLALDVSPNAKFTIFTAYHECAHIAHGDGQSPQPLTDPRTNPANKTYIEQVERYSNLAKSSLDASTQTGKELVATLSQTQTFWQTPPGKQVPFKALQGRLEETRADITAFKAFFEQGQYDVMCYIIHLWATQNDKQNTSTTSAHYYHPSYKERALYLAGFLTDKGMAINAVLQVYEKARTSKIGIKHMNTLIQAFNQIAHLEKTPDIERFFKIFEATVNKECSIDVNTLLEAYKAQG